MRKDNIIGKSIRENRKAAQLSQVVLAAKIGVTHAAVSFWENGQNVPGVDVCWRIADVLSVSIDELVGRV